MFLLNSRLGLFTAIPGCFSCKSLDKPGHPFFRSYGVIMPSYLTRVLSSALASSAHLPVSVCGTVTRIIHESRIFLAAWLNQFSQLASGSSSPLVLKPSRICLREQTTGLNPHIQSRDGLPFCVPPSLKHYPGGA